MVASSPALTVESLTVALGESGGVSELSATPIAQQLSSTTSFHHVMPVDCSGRRRLHQSIIIFTCAASRCLESAVIVHRSHLRRSGIVDLRFKMIIFKSCPIGPDRLHTACSCALCRARCFELRLPFVAFDQSYQTDRVWQLRSTAFGHQSLSAEGAGGEGGGSTLCGCGCRHLVAAAAPGSHAWQPVSFTWQPACPGATAARLPQDDCAAAPAIRGVAATKRGVAAA